MRSGKGSTGRRTADQLEFFASINDGTAVFDPADELWRGTDGIGSRGAHAERWLGIGGAVPGTGTEKRR